MIANTFCAYTHKMSAPEPVAIPNALRSGPVRSGFYPPVYDRIRNLMTIVAPTHYVSMAMMARTVSYHARATRGYTARPFAGRTDLE